jgi:predicted porin
MVLACACASAYAQADTIVYGRASLSYDQLFGGNLQGPTRFITSDSTRFGLKGGDDIGGGYRAIFQIETAIALDDASAGAFANRDSFVGFTEPAGTVKIGGSRLNAVDDAHPMFGTGNLTGIAASTVLWGNG